MSSIFAGMKIIVDDTLTQNAELQQFRFPRSRRKRIRRKWAKNRANYRLVVTERWFFVSGGSAVVMSSRHYRQLLEYCPPTSALIAEG